MIDDAMLQRMATQFDKTPTAATIGFEIVVFLATAVVLWLASRHRRNVIQHYALVAVGVLIFEVFTAPMWNNDRLGVWAYVYKDVSWVLTMGWATMIVGAVFLVDHRLPEWPAWRRFFLSIGILTLLVAVAEGVVVLIGVRSYAPEVLAVLDGTYIAGTPVSLHLLYYAPVFLSLVVAFYKYWAPLVDGMPLPEPTAHGWVRSLVFGFVGVFFFEVMIEPMVDNRGFPAWSYVYHDITVVLTGFWLALIVFTTSLVDVIFSRSSARARFFLYLLALYIISAPIEGWLISSGMRVYGPSATANFVGLKTLIFDIPVEVIAAIPLYLALVICFMRYWARITAPDLKLVTPAVATASRIEPTGQAT